MCKYMYIFYWRNEMQYFQAKCATELFSQTKGYRKPSVMITLITALFY